MTALTDPVHVEVPTRTPVLPAFPLHRPPQPKETGAPPRRSRRATVRTSTTTRSYRSWERAIGAARSLAARSGIASSVTSEFDGIRFDVAPDGCASPRRS